MVVQGGGEKSDPTHSIRQLTEYSCWANGAWIDFIEKNLAICDLRFVICDW